jgi:hypothetical protein
MRHVREASFKEYVTWYLARERRKRGQGPDPAQTPLDRQITHMQRSHPAKLRPWFERARWSIVLLDTVDEAMDLVCVDNWETRRTGLMTTEGADRRLAGTLVARARATGYFDNVAVIASNALEAHYRQDRISAYRTACPEFYGEDRLMICELNAEEQLESPRAKYYLNDGFGRLLSYLYLVINEGLEYRPVEAILAQAHAGRG